MISSKTAIAPAARALSTTPSRYPGSGSSAPAGSRITPRPARFRAELPRGPRDLPSGSFGSAPGRQPVRLPSARWSRYPVMPTVIAADQHRVAAICARASRMAAAVASEPVLAKRTRSTPGTRSTIISATSTSIGWGRVKTIPSRSWRSIASVTAGWEWPRITGPRAIGRSIAVAVHVPNVGALRASGVGRCHSLHPLGRVLGERLRPGGDHRPGAGEELPRTAHAVSHRAVPSALPARRRRLAGSRRSSLLADEPEGLYAPNPRLNRAMPRSFDVAGSCGSIPRFSGPSSSRRSPLALSQRIASQ